MDMAELLPNLYLLPFPFGHVYFYRDADTVTAIDTGVAGSAPVIAEALRRLGLPPGAVRNVVLTHHHQDHAGSASELAAWGADVLAHRDDAPVVRGERLAAPPVFTGAPAWERELYASLPSLPPAPPCPVHRELADGDVIDFGGGATVVGAPGHTDGSIAIHLPGPRVLFTGDAVAANGDEVILGVFNTDRARAIRSLRRLAELDVDVVCFGHGEPVVGGAAAALRAAAERVA
ncbi:MBL fold metallo-hydrolase [Marinactinospora rubrisoli]|uniref:MBL fold metallo-hydrolase n=1 Tax=Marinactinospora rubrisoli TaxID=2715399 RepID=A0ABW2KHC3_9ACTN